MLLFVWVFIFCNVFAVVSYRLRPCIVLLRVFLFVVLVLFLLYYCVLVLFCVCSFFLWFSWSLLCSVCVEVLVLERLAGGTLCGPFWRQARKSEVIMCTFW